MIRIGENDFWKLLEDGEIPRVILFHKQKIVKTWDEELPDKADIKSYISP